MANLFFVTASYKILHFLLGRIYDFKAWSSQESERTNGFNVFYRIKKKVTDLTFNILLLKNK